MKGFRVLLLAMLVVLAIYTAVVGFRHGWDLLSVFFGDIGSLTWPGQFNLDFMFMLALSAIWVAWRHDFSPAGLGLAFFAFIGGALFLTIYLLVITGQSRGDVRMLLLGEKRTRA